MITDHICNVIVVREKKSKRDQETRNIQEKTRKNQVAEKHLNIQGRRVYLIWFPCEPSHA